MLFTLGPNQIAVAIPPSPNKAVDEQKEKSKSQRSNLLPPKMRKNAKYPTIQEDPQGEDH